MTAAPPADTGRLRYPAHEDRHPWLARLLDAYHISDTAARRELALESARRGAPPACGKGCRVCCEGQVIPVSAFEALGLWWFAAEAMPGAARQGLRDNLARLAERDGTPGEDEPAPGSCVFLVDGACAAYPLRPFICRQHHVFGERCSPGENLRQTRPGDIFNTGHDDARDMAWLLLPLYGVPAEDIDRRFESGYVASRSRALHALPLLTLVTHMDAADGRKARTNA